MIAQVSRQQALRLRLLEGAYSALLEDPDGFMQASSLDFRTLGEHEDKNSGENGGEDDDIDFATKPPSASEIKAGTYYLGERGLLLLMPSEQVTKLGLDPKEIYVHITAAGVEVFESLVLANENAMGERVIGFKIGASSHDAGRPTGVPASSRRPAVASVPDELEIG